MDTTNRVKILLVDDKPENLLALEALLADQGHELVKATSGREALRWLLKEECAVILLDVQMPDMDGFETATFIRQRERTARTPIIFVTALSKTEIEMLRGYAIGAVDYVIKPIVPEVLRAKVQVFIDLFRMREEVRRQADALAAANRDLVLANQQLESASRHKSEFLANMSHEFRTPLNAIIGFSEILGDTDFGPLTEKQARFAQNILSSGQHLLVLVNDLLDLSKVEAGKVELRPEPFEFREAVHASVAEIRPLVELKHHNLELHVDEAPPTLTADPVRFKQILLNLLSNAVKFTPNDGRITVTARHTRHPGEFVDIAVTDTGIGIKPEDLPRLFQEFVRLDAAVAHRAEGTGLGLALTKKLVELHGGTIAAVSEGEGRGSTFTVRLPVGQRSEGEDGAVA